MATEYLLGLRLDRTGLFAWPSGEAKAVTIPLTLPTGRTTADWDSFVATVYADPKWPRSGADLCADVDPKGDGWAVAATADGTAGGDAEVDVALTTPLPAGTRRYAVDVVGVGGAAGGQQLVPMTWLTVLPSSLPAG